MRSVISPSDIQRAVHRARLMRRDAAEKRGEPTGAWQEQYSAVLEREAKPTKKPHWYRVGMVHDGQTGDDFRVYLHELTGEIRLWTPPFVPPPKPEAAPLLHSIYGPKHYIADDRYRFFLNGVEYSPRECERICEERKSVKGWTWRRRDAES
jgi:hypothetical protein